MVWKWQCVHSNYSLSNNNEVTKIVLLLCFVACEIDQKRHNQAENLRHVITTNFYSFKRVWVHLSNVKNFRTNDALNNRFNCYHFPFPILARLFSSFEPDFFATIKFESYHVTASFHDTWRLSNCFLLGNIQERCHNASSYQRKLRCTSWRTERH